MPPNSITSGLGSLIHEEYDTGTMTNHVTEMATALENAMGSNTISIGYHGLVNTTGSQNIFVGRNAGTTATTGTYWMWYGNMERPKKRKLVLRLP